MIETFHAKGGPYTMPDYIHAGLLDWVEHGHCGGFLAAALAGDFFDACFRADSTVALHLVDIAKFIYNELPRACHGSREQVRDWALAKRA